MSGPFGSTPHNLFNTTSTSFYNGVINQSLRLNRADSAHLYKTWGSAADSNQIFTFSIWAKRHGKGDGSNDLVLIQSRNSGSGTGQGSTLLGFYRDSSLLYYTENGGRNARSKADFVDCGGWAHFCWQYDSTQSTAEDRVKIFVNGVHLVTGSTNWTSAGFGFPEVPAENSVMTSMNQNGQLNAIGAGINNSVNYGYFDGYIANVIMLDGVTTDCTAFGEFKEGIWIPKEYEGSFGSNGYHLDFADSSALGNDVSGNNNDWTSSGLAATDVVPDTPENNFSTLNSLKVNTQTQTFAQGNLDFSSTQTSTNPAVTNTFAVSSGKWYWEVYIRAKGNHVNSVGIASNPNDLENDNYALYSKSTAYSYQANGNKRNNGDSSYGDTWDTGDIIGVALDLDAGAVYFYKNGSIQNSGTAAFTSLSGEFTSYSLIYSSGAQVYNFGQDSSFAGNKTSGSANASDSGGQGDFYYAVPSGYLAQNSTNLPEPTIGPNSAEQNDDHFDTALYEGTGSSQNITSLNFQPDWVWVKRRDGVQEGSMTDSVRGVTKQLRPAVANQESTFSDLITSFNSDGFSLGADASGNNSYNYYTDSHVAWCWKGGGTAVSNSDGSITSSVSANPDAGFSIVSYTGDGTATVGHGLGKVPESYWVKCRSNGSTNWRVYHSGVASDPETDYLTLDTTAAAQDQTFWNDTAPTSDVFSVFNFDDTGTASRTYIAYVFAEVEGHCKIGSYFGNGGSQFVHTGFRPAWVLEKRTNTSAWNLYDNKRTTGGVAGFNMAANNTPASLPHEADADATYAGLHFLSNGFRPLGTLNDAGTTIVFIAFAEAPFKYSNAR